MGVRVDGQTYNPVVEPAEGWNRQPLADRSEARQQTIQRVIDRSSAGIADMIRVAIAPFSEEQPATYNGTPVSVLELENRIRPQRFESAAVFNEDGAQILFKDGAQYEVDFTWGEIAQMQGGILTHNHPRGWEVSPEHPGRGGNSFSREDWDMAVAGNLAEMRAVSPGWRHAVKKPNGGWPSEAELKRILDRAEREVRAILGPPIAAAQGRGDTALAQQLVDEANARHWHEVALRVSQEIGS